MRDAQHADIKAIFAHLDIIGAQFNHKQQAMQGLTRDALPSGVPVFTGHYHNPHVVSQSDIIYIGSPFERAILTVTCIAAPTHRKRCKPDCHLHHAGHRAEMLQKY